MHTQHTQGNILIPNLLKGIKPTTNKHTPHTQHTQGNNITVPATHTRHRNPQGETRKFVKKPSVEGSKATVNASEARGP